MATDMVMRYDCHTHILPGIDDGSKSVEESMEMLRESARQGIRFMAATSHFYASENTPETFLSRREKAWEKLETVMAVNQAISGEELPRVITGAEVYYFSGMSHSDTLPLLTIGDSRVLLLEMPFAKWHDSVIHEVCDMCRRSDIRVVLAHINRYIKYQDKSVWPFLLENGVLMQVNAEAFIGSWLATRHMFYMMKEGYVHLLGSDCHNMSSRKPNLQEAVEHIEKKLGVGYLEQINDCAMSLFG